MRSLKTRALRFVLTVAATLGLLAMMPSAASVLATSTPVNYGLSLTWSPDGSTTVYDAIIQHGASLHPLFQFWINAGQGWHMAQNYSTQYAFHLPASQAPDTLVQAFVLSPQALAAGDYQQAQWATAWANPQASETLTTPSSPVVGTTYTVTAASSNLAHPVYQLWVKSPSGQWTASGAYQTSPTFSWTPSVNGSYEFASYARDSALPAFPVDELLQTATVSTAGQPTSVLLQSALPFVPAGATKPLTATVLNAAGTVVSNYSGPVTLAVKAAGAFTVHGPSGPVASGTVTVNATNGRAVFLLTGGATLGATGTVTATAPFLSSATSPASLTVVADSPTAQVGYSFFTAGGTRISSAHPLLVTTPGNFLDSVKIPVTLKPVNVLGQPVAASFSDNAVLSPAEGATSPHDVVPGFGGPGVEESGSAGPPSFNFQEYVFVNRGATSVDLEFFPGPAPGLTILSALPQTLVAHGAEITSITSASGTVLTPVSDKAGNLTVTGVQPATTYRVTAQVVDQFGQAVDESAFHGVPSVTISSSGPRTTAAMVSAPTVSASGQWTFTYVSGSSANQSDSLVLGAGPPLTTNPY